MMLAMKPTGGAPEHTIAFRASTAPTRGARGRRIINGAGEPASPPPVRETPKAPARYAERRARATLPGVPEATIFPPPAPPSGPRSITMSASATTSRLCSITTTVLPASTSRCSTRTSFSTSAMCSPMVGSSST